MTICEEVKNNTSEKQQYACLKQALTKFYVLRFVVL